MSSLATVIQLDATKISDPLPLRLLRDELGVDADVATPAGASAALPRLVLLTTAGFAAQGACTGLLLMAFGQAGPLSALLTAAQLSLAMTGGFFIAICAGLPGYWFHTVVMGISPPIWRIAIELVRVQSVGSVVLSAVLPLWVSGWLALWLVGGNLGADPIMAGAALPLLCALPGMMGLYRVFCRMSVHESASGQLETPPPMRARLTGLALTSWWGIAFVCTAPVTFIRLFQLIH